MRSSAELCRAFEITNTTGEQKIVTTEVRKKMKDGHAETHNKNHNMASSNVNNRTTQTFTRN